MNLLIIATIIVLAWILVSTVVVGLCKVASHADSDSDRLFAALR